MTLSYMNFEKAYRCFYICRHWWCHTFHFHLENVVRGVVEVLPLLCQLVVSLSGIQYLLRVVPHGKELYHDVCVSRVHWHYLDIIIIRTVVEKVVQSTLKMVLCERGRLRTQWVVTVKHRQPCNNTITSCWRRGWPMQYKWVSALG